MAIRNDSAMEISTSEFQEIINNGHELVVVDFFADWCMPCLMLAPVIEDLAECFESVKFVKLNIDENDMLANKYKVSSIPCLVVFKKGVEVDRIIGNQGQEAIEIKINKHLN